MHVDVAANLMAIASAAGALRASGYALFINAVSTGSG
jgi:hypothetical protein